MVFNLKCTYNELIEKVLEFRVLIHVPLYVRMVHHHDTGLVGFFKMDLSMLYKQTPHIFRAKWLTLSDKHAFGEVKVRRDTIILPWYHTISEHPHLREQLLTPYSIVLACY